MIKCIENYTEEELRDKLPSIPYDKIHIVYKYLHKPRTITADSFARQHCLSVSTLYRYIKDVKDMFKAI